jgi:hypothetical protein
MKNDREEAHEPEYQSMNSAGPIFNPETRYRIEVQGRVDVEWLQSFDDAAGVRRDVASQAEDITVLEVCADQSGIVGLVRRLHGLGLAILKVQIVQEGDDCA